MISIAKENQGWWHFAWMTFLVRKDDEELRDSYYRIFKGILNAYYRWYTDFGGRKSKYEYGSWNHLLREIDPKGGITEYSYTPSEQASIAHEGRAPRPSS